MTDLIVGLGEIGKPIFDLLKLRGFDVDGYDIKNPTNLKEKYDYIHICFPYSDDFITQVRQYQKLGNVIVHSTVKPGTCKILNCIYSPIRGVHATMLHDLQYYEKYYSGNENVDIEVRFKVVKNIPDSTILETTKIIVDTTYYGFLIAFRKYVDSKYDVDWEFAREINDKLGNRPIMYNDYKPIGGHCVLQNLKLIDDNFFNNMFYMVKDK